MNKSLLTVFATVLLGFSAYAQTPQIIPQPVSLQTHTGKFKLNKLTKIVVPAGDAETTRIGQLLAGMLSGPTGYPITVSTAVKPSNMIRLKLNKTADPVLGEEGYKLKVVT